jgi:flagella basal body P-ring formation protein FlgA
MHNDKILSKSDFEMVSIKVENLPSNILSCDIEPNLITKSYISKDSFLTYNKLEIKKDLLKGAHIRAYIADGNLVIGVDSTLLEDANIGDRVKILTENNKYFYAKLLSNSEAMILK